MARLLPGAKVRVLDRPAQGHVRVPRYIRGKCGQVEAYLGAFLNPEDLAFGRSSGPVVPLYHVRFQQHGIWDDYTGPRHDAVLIEIPEHWLEQEPSP